MEGFEFLIKKNCESHVNNDIELFYVMEGPVDFFLEDRHYNLEKDDFIIVNVDRKHGYNADKNCLIASMHISYAKLCKMLKTNVVFFWCNTAIDNNEICEEVRIIIKKIITEQNKDDPEEIYLHSLYYELLCILTHDFLLNKDDAQYADEVHKFDERKHNIAEYIRLNYDKQISLGELADKLYLSNAYLSKYIKKQFGMSFIDYVNNVRLNHAVEQLLYSDKSVVRIAMDTGFASSAALNKTFKEKYSMTPSAYRSQWKDKEKKNRNTVKDEAAIRRQLTNYLKEAGRTEERKSDVLDETISFNKSKKSLLDKNWNQMINVGAAADLLNSETQKQVLFLKENLGFKYVRFWDLYAPEMYIDIKKDNFLYNFSKLDQILDFLLQNDLKPYMELRIKPKKIIKNSRELIFYREIDENTESEESITKFMKSLAIHLINRYTKDEVESWYFEIWKTEREEYINRVDILDKDASVPMYLDRFEQMARSIREYLPEARIGGGGFTLRYGEDNFRQILTQWKARKELPNFISIYNYPYTVDTMAKEKNQTMDPSFMEKHLKRVREIMEETEFPVKELHASEWSFSVSSRNILNDSCMKGAFLMKNMIDCIGIADIMGYWLASDQYADFYDSNNVLNGSGGLLSKDGIPKPSFYAFDFMNRLGKYLRKRGDNYIITDNGMGNWRIACHNLKRISYRYGLYYENEITVNERNGLFVDNKKKHLHFEVPALRSGTYVLRVFSVNAEHGSIQDEWEKLVCAGEIFRDDIEYLKRIVTPRLVMVKVESKNEKLIFDTVLEPNEIQFIHVSYQFEKIDL